MKINFSGVISVDIQEFAEVSPRESFEAYMDFLERIGKAAAELATEARTSEKARLDRLIHFCNTGEFDG